MTLREARTFHQNHFKAGIIAWKYIRFRSHNYYGYLCSPCTLFQYMHTTYMCLQHSTTNEHSDEVYNILQQISTVTVHYKLSYQVKILFCSTTT